MPLGRFALNICHQHPAAAPTGNRQKDCYSPLEHPESVSHHLHTDSHQHSSFHYADDFTILMCNVFLMSLKKYNIP